jgi:hypothetical protein
MPTRTVAFLAAVSLLAAVAPDAAQAGPDASPSCRASQLRGSFAVVHGSAGAGNIVYRLVLENRSSVSCSLAALPRATLIGRNGRALPTHVAARAVTGAPVALGPGAAGQALARFSPDVPGPGEPVSARCEPVAYRLRVGGRGGVVAVPVVPPTSVCEHGTLQFSVYRRS